MIGRADIEGSKSNVAMNAWLPQASSNYTKYTPTGRNSSYLKAPEGPAPCRALKCLYKSPLDCLEAFPEPDALPRESRLNPSSKGSNRDNWTFKAHPCGNFSGTSSLKFRC